MPLILLLKNTAKQPLMTRSFLFRGTLYFSPQSKQVSTKISKACLCLKAATHTEKEFTVEAWRLELFATVWRYLKFVIQFLMTSGQIFFFLMFILKHFVFVAVQNLTAVF